MILKFPGDLFGIFVEIPNFCLSLDMLAEDCLHEKLSNFPLEQN
jgi:hypothetical protein